MRGRPPGPAALALLAAAVCAAPSAARATGASVDLGYTSSFGPDAYGTLHGRVWSDEGLTVGVLAVGGTQPAWLASGGRSAWWGDDTQVRAELLLGVLRSFGPSAGAEVELRRSAGPAVAVVGAGWVAGLGMRAGAGVDATPAAGWTLQPRLGLETWAGGRDPALRVSLGLRRALDDGGWIAVSASGGGRDVVHMGPGVALSLGRGAPLPPAP